MLFLVKKRIAVWVWPQILYSFVKKRMAIWMQLSFFNLLSKSNWLFGNNFKNFVFCSQRMKDSLGTILNFLFLCEKRMAVWVQFSKFCISLLKKRMVAWVHALRLITFSYYHYFMLSGKSVYTAWLYILAYSLEGVKLLSS